MREEKEENLEQKGIEGDQAVGVENQNKNLMLGCGAESTFGITACGEGHNPPQGRRLAVLCSKAVCNLKESYITL